MEIDQTAANALFEEGAMIVLLNVPPGTEIGIDMKSWTVGERFKGIKMIPPGLHFIYFSASDPSGQLAPRTGFFRVFKRGEIVVRNWDQKNEIFLDEIVDEEELGRFREHKKELDKSCGPYPYESYKMWVSLTKYVTEDVLIRVQPTSGFVLSCTSLISVGSTTKERAAMAKSPEIPLCKLTEDTLLPDMKQAPGTFMNYTPLDGIPEGAQPGDRTKFGLDWSSRLESLISKVCSWQKVLGELQLAFLCFLLGQQYDSFEQWKRLVHLLCSCEEAIAKYEQLFVETMGVLHFQVKEIPEDFFVDIVSSSNFLTSTLHNLFANIAESSGSQVVKSRGKKFSESLTRRFGWDFTHEPDEFAPVVVDADGNY